MVTVLSAISLLLASLLGHQTTGLDVASPRGAWARLFDAVSPRGAWGRQRRELRRLADAEDLTLLPKPVDPNANLHDVTVISGDLLKFAKGGKGKPSNVNVAVTQRPGEPEFSVPDSEKNREEQTAIPVGWTPGHLIVQWRSESIDWQHRLRGEHGDEPMIRAVVTKVTDGAAAVTEMKYEGRTFSLATQPNDKVVAFAAKAEEEKKRWLAVLTAAMEGINKQTEEMLKEFEVEVTFEQRPLGFRVEEMFLKTDDGMTEALVVTKIEDSSKLREKGVVVGADVVQCNGKSFDGIPYAEKLEAIKGAETPFTLKFRGRKYMKAEAPKPEPHPANESPSTGVTAEEAAELLALQQAYGEGDGLIAPGNQPVVGN